LRCDDRAVPETWTSLPPPLWHGGEGPVLLTSLTVTKPVLEATRLRVDVGGVPEVDGLSFETTGDRVLVLAGPNALFHAAAGLIEPRHGELATGGFCPHEAVRQRLLAGAPLDPPLPPSWTAHEYVVWSSRLAGHGRADAEALATDALARLKLESFSKVRLRHVPPPARRALVVAGALATGATTLFLEDPVRGMAEDAARTLSRAILRATSGMRMVVFAPRTSLASPFAIDADEVLILAAGSVLAQGAPAEVAARDRSYAVRLHGGGPDFARVAEKRGARVSGQGANWTVDLGDTLRPNDLLDVAAAAGAVILELRPLSHAFA
jgi:ABC-type multidrug transport system ATPase subunit